MFNASSRPLSVTQAGASSATPLPHLLPRIAFFASQHHCAANNSAGSLSRCPQQVRGCAPSHCTSASNQVRPLSPSPPPRQAKAGPSSVAALVLPNETAEQAMVRRVRESEQVAARVHDIYTKKDFEQALKDAGTDLVVLEVQSEKVCETGLDEPEVEVQWKLDEEKVKSQELNRCVEVKHVFQRVARECTDVRFLHFEVDNDGGQDLVESLGIEVLPTLQFYRNGVKLYEHRGVMNMNEGVGEGVLYYGDRAANNLAASDFITYLHGQSDFDQFVGATPDDRILTVVYVSLGAAAPCLRIFPAVLALAKNFTGYAKFARLEGDENKENEAIMGRMGVVEVPTFLFYRGGKEVGRHVGSSRGDLIGQILQQQASAGVSAPQPTRTTTPKARRKMVRRV